MVVGIRDAPRQIATPSAKLAKACLNYIAHNWEEVLDVYIEKLE